MKNLFIILSVVLFMNNAQGQISDAQAKIEYQKIEEQFDKEQYAYAFSLSNQLKDKMGNLPPKLGYMLYKSAYLALQGNEEIRWLPMNYKTIDSMTIDCSAFIKTLNKANYPEEKYNELLNILSYFENQKKKYEHQKDRKPQDAIDFLNECAKRFAREDTDDDIKQTNKIYFSLNGKYLRIEYDEQRYFSRTGGYIMRKYAVYIDLSQITGIVSYVGDLQGNEMYENGRKVVAGIVYKKLYEEHYSDFKQYVKAKAKAKLPDDKTSAEEALTNWEHCRKWNIFGYNEEVTCYNFVSSSQEYKEGKYNNRIKEAFQFLIDYFPKKKEEAAEQTKSKF